MPRTVILAPVSKPDEGTLLDIRVVPGATRNEVGGQRAGRLLVRTTASLVGGKANTAVCKQVAEYLGVRARCVTIASGQRSRDKVLRITA